MSYAPGGLLPNFIGGAVVMRLPVGRVTVLIGIKIFFGIGGDNFVYAPNCAVGGFIAGRDLQCCSISNKDALALVRSAVRKAQGHRVAEGRADHGVGNTGVPAGGVDNSFTWD